MKNLFFIFFISFFISCAASPTSPSSESDKSSKSFKIDVWTSSDVDDSQVKSVSMKLVAEGSKVIIYADSRVNIDTISSSYWSQIANEFDKNYVKLTEVYGVHTDVDKNGKVILIFHKMPDGLGGYFIATDLFKEFNRNNAEVIYVNISYLTSSFNLVETMSTVFHELQHLINFSMTVIVSDYTVQSDLWLNEALSESTYFVYQDGKINDTRFKYYNAAYTSDEISKGSYFYNFGNTVTPYITASMFMYWLYLHGGGSDILQQITLGGVTTGLNYDYRAVVNAVNSSITQLSTADWSTILGTWLEANFVNNTTSIYGYKNKYKFIPKQFTGSTTAALNPGGAIYTSTAANITDVRIKTKDITSGSKTWKLVYNPDVNLENIPVSVTVPLINKPATLKAYSVDENVNNRDLWIDIVRHK